MAPTAAMRERTARAWIFMAACQRRAWDTSLKARRAVLYLQAGLETGPTYLRLSLVYSPIQCWLEWFYSPNALKIGEFHMKWRRLTLTWEHSVLDASEAYRWERRGPQYGIHPLDCAPSEGLPIRPDLETGVSCHGNSVDILLHILA